MLRRRRTRRQRRITRSKQMLQEPVHSLERMVGDERVTAFEMSSSTVRHHEWYKRQLESNEFSFDAILLSVPACVSLFIFFSLTSSWPVLYSLPPFLLSLFQLSTVSFLLLGFASSRPLSSFPLCLFPSPLSFLGTTASHSFFLLFLLLLLLLLLLIIIIIIITIIIIIIRCWPPLSSSSWHVVCFAFLSSSRSTSSTNAGAPKSVEGRGTRRARTRCRQRSAWR